MERKVFNKLKKDIRSLLRVMDDSFVPNHVYDGILKCIVPLRIYAYVLPFFVIS